MGSRSTWCLSWLVLLIWWPALGQAVSQVTKNESADAIFSTG
jgi:hypothetical protein